MRPTSQCLSIALHAALILLALLWPTGGPASAPEVQRPQPTPMRLIWRRAVPQASPSGGGRPSESRASTKGTLPQVLRPVFIPPTPQHVAQPKLILDSGIDTAVPRIDLPSLGDPLASLSGPPSSGVGTGPGIGSRGHGPYGQSDGDGRNGIVAPVLGATPPVLVHKVEPDYSDEARKNHFQGTVLLAVDIDERGEVSNVRVLRPLGLGLDEKAVAAVRHWRFKPARKNGRAISYPAAIEVRFQLL